MRIARGLAATIVAAIAVPASASAALQWQAPESIPSAASALSLGPDGTGLLFGFPSNTGYTRLAVRPLGGPLGSPQALPAPIGFGGSTPVVGQFADGSALIADPSSLTVAFRPAGAAAAVGPAQMLGSPNSPAAIATVASGEALIGLDGGTTQPAGVAFRPAGASAQVDIANKQTFGPDVGRLIGVVLDPAGGAVVVWIDGTIGPNGGAIYQAVRAPGASSFGTPTQILATSPYRVRMASDPSGYAVLSWLGGPPGDPKGGYGTQVTASLRSPGGAFAPATVIATEPAGLPTSVLPAVTSNGDALVAWDGSATFTMCAGGTGDDSNGGAFYATSHNGAWGGKTPLASSQWPNTSAVDGVASAGNTVAIAYFTQTDHDGIMCNLPRSDSTASFVLTGKSTSVGITFDATQPTVSEVQNALGQYLSAGFVSMSVNPSGGVLYQYSQYPATGPPGVWLLAREDRSAGTGGNGGGGGGGGGGIKPIVPKNLVVPAAINPAKPLIVATCPLEVADECAFRVWAYGQFGAVPKALLTTAAKKKKAPKAVLLGTGKAVLRPGKKGKIKLSFTSAGRKALRKHKAVPIRIRVRVTYDHKAHVFVYGSRISAPRKARHTSRLQTASTTSDLLGFL